MNAPQVMWIAVPLPPPCSKTDPPQQAPLLDASSDGIVDAFDEELYWARYFRSEPGYDPSRSFEQYAPAYRLGIAWRLADDQRAWNDCEHELRSIWERHSCSECLPWELARGPVQAAWTRVHNALSWRH
jgi:hypothetical protein